MTDAPRPVSRAYAAIMRSVEWRLVELGWSMDHVEDRAGLSEHYLSKVLHPDSKTGKHIQWPTLDLVMDAIFPTGYKVLLCPDRPAFTDVSANRLASRQAQAANVVLRRNLRAELYRELGKNGGRARTRSLDADRRSKLASMAAHARWQRARLAKDPCN